MITFNFATTEETLTYMIRRDGSFEYFDETKAVVKVIINHKETAQEIDSELEKFYELWS